VQNLTHRNDADGQALAADALLQRTVGQIDARLKTAWWALLGALDELGEGFQYPVDDARLNVCMLAKRCVVLEAQAVVDLAIRRSEAPRTSGAHRWNALIATYAPAHSIRWRPIRHCCMPGGWRSVNPRTRSCEQTWRTTLSFLTPSVLDHLGLTTASPAN
jgi:hypothetical protein